MQTRHVRRLAARLSSVPVRLVGPNRDRSLGSSPFDGVPAARAYMRVPPPITSMTELSVEVKEVYAVTT